MNDVSAQQQWLSSDEYFAEYENTTLQTDSLLAVYYFMLM